MEQSEDLERQVEEGPNRSLKRSLIAYVAVNMLLAGFVLTEYRIGKEIWGEKNATQYMKEQTDKMEELQFPILYKALLPGYYLTSKYVSME